MEFVASLRFLARRRAVAAVAVLTMACALGVNASALAVLRAFLFSSLGVPEPDRLVLLGPERELPGRGNVLFNDAYPNYELIRDTRRAFSDVTVLLPITVSLKNGDDIRPLQAAKASASFFATMRVSPILGRPFTAEEEGPSPAPVVVLSHALWSGAFLRDKDIVGRSLTIDGIPTTVIGVMPEGFTQPAPTDVWLPFDIPAVTRGLVAGGRTLSIFGRMADGVSRESAVAEVNEFTRRTREASADNREYAYRMQALREQLLTGADSTVMLIQAAAGALLLLAVLNLMSLLVAWGFERRQEMAIRLALGGGRAQVIRLLIAQSALIVGAGLVVGVALAFGLIGAARQLDLGPQLGFFVGQLRVDTTVLLICIPLAAVVALVAGILPALFSAERALAPALRSSNRSASHSSGALRLQRLMVVAQASLSVVVLASAAVVGLSFRNLSAVPDGFDVGNRVVARVILPDERYPTHAARVAFASALLNALERETGLSGFSFTTTLPVGDVRFGGRFKVPDANGALSEEPTVFHFRRVSPEYLRVMGLALLRGRHFSATDDSSSTRVAMISQATAEQYWPNQDPVGQRMYRMGAPGAPPVPFEVIGVVADAMDGGYEVPRGQAVYVPFTQVSIGRMSIVARSRTTVADGLVAIRRALKAADPLIAPTGTTTLTSIVSTANVLPQLRATILLVFAVAAVIIAGLGSYGVMRQLVANREREFALRLVFGAVPSDLAREVLLQVARLTVPGVVVGLAGAWMSASLLRAFVFGIEPRSGAVLALVSLVVLVLATMTAAPSVRRAMRVDVRAGTGA